MNSKSDKVMRVLMVEDNPLALCTGRVCLEKMGCQVSEAVSCAEAEDMWKNRDFDLIVMDYRLPDGLGTEVIERMRAAGYENNVICLTAETENISEVSRRNLRIAKVLNKPMDIDMLKSAVSEACLNSRINPDVDRGKDQRSPEKLKVVEWEQRVGRFALVACPPDPALEFLEKINHLYATNEWVALDMRSVEMLENMIIDACVKAADMRLAAGGRLCLAGVSETLRAYLSEHGVDRLLDIVGDIQALEPLGRRLASASERNAVLDSIVLRS